MPLYEYSCSTCGETFKRLIPFGEKPAKQTCPEGHPNIRRVYSAPTIASKGSGWYATEHKNQVKNQSSKSD